VRYLRSYSFCLSLGESLARIVVTGVMTKGEAKTRRGVTTNLGVTQAGVTRKTHGDVTIVTVITAITTTGIKRN